MSRRCLTPATLYYDPDLPMKQGRAIYLESMFMCVTPLALTPLATMMYQKFKATCPGHLQEVKEYDEKKVHCYFCTIIQIEILNMLFLQVKQLGNCLILSGIEDEDIYDSTVSLYMHTTEY